MITLTMRGELLLKAFGNALALLVGPLTLAAILWTVTENPDLGSCSFRGGLFLCILAVLTDDLSKREALVTPHSQEQPAALSPSSPLVQVLRLRKNHQFSNHTIVDLMCGAMDLHVTRCTDVGRSTCIPGHDTSAFQITQDS